MAGRLSTDSRPGIMPGLPRAGERSAVSTPDTWPRPARAGAEAVWEAPNVATGPESPPVTVEVEKAL